MVRITLELIRKRSEHNEGEISTLEEIALHQENIDKIVLIERHCRNLKILLLQHNLISEIENLGMLKRLVYLNLALNNIEVIQNLEGLESLKKLDLTVNFIGNIQSAKSLRCNENLEQLILMGNPCTDYEHYRQYVVAILPQLQELDMVTIERSERIKALQMYARARDNVIEEYRHYEKTKATQQETIQRRRKEHAESIKNKHENTEANSESEDERFWKESSYHTPEDRVLIAERFLKRQEKKDHSSDKSSDCLKRELKLFGKDGRPYNINQAKLSFKLNDENDPNFISLEVFVYRHLDTSYIDVNVNPMYIRVTVKGKILQLTLPCEVSIEKSTVQRNTITGSLVITMSRLNPSTVIVKKKESEEMEKKKKKETIEHKTIVQASTTSRRALLEIGPPTDIIDFLRVTKDSSLSATNPTQKNSINEPKKQLEYFEDNLDVPPLEEIKMI